MLANSLPGERKKAVKRLDSLQAVRAAASVLVVLFHTQSILMLHSGFMAFAGVFGNGDKGVDLFFVLSGFIMVYIHAGDVGHRHQIRHYSFARFTRIYPMVWLISIFAIIAYGLGFDPAKDVKLEPWSLINSLLLLPQNTAALVNVTWTLKYEVFFYALFGTLLFNRRLGLAVLAAWQGTAFILWVFQVPADPLWAFYFRPIVLEFNLGMLAGWIAVTVRPSIMGDRGPLVCLCVGGLWFFSSVLLGPSWPRVFAFGVPAMLIILGCAGAERLNQLRVPRKLKYLGDASYTLYLVHFSVITLGASVMRHFHQVNNISAGVLVALGLGAGLAAYEFVDKPLSRLIRRQGFSHLGHEQGHGAERK